MKKYIVLNIISNLLLVVLSILILIFFAFTSAFVAIGGNQDAVNQHMMIGYSLIAVVVIALILRTIGIICYKDSKTCCAFILTGLIALSGAFGGMEYFFIINCINSFDIATLMYCIATPIILSLYYLLDIFTVKYELQ